LSNCSVMRYLLRLSETRRILNPLFALRYFSLLQVKTLFKQAGGSLSFLPCNVSHSKQAALFSFPHLLSEVSLHPLLRGPLFSWSPFPLIHINIQFSIDYFLDREGHQMILFLHCSKSIIGPVLVHPFYV